MSSLLDAEEIPAYNQRREVAKGLLQIASGVGALLLLCAHGHGDDYLCRGGWIPSCCLNYPGQCIDRWMDMLAVC